MTDHEICSLLCACCGGDRTGIDVLVRDAFATPPVTELGGRDHIHIGRNLGPTPLVAWIVYIEPAGTPLSVEVPDPGCGFI